ncbi:Glycosyltransferase family 25 (LPS biosynthesis protein) [Pseudooceanicola marinus]|uniref:Glycosyltransferase family 25 (LPS biosynthesis protein) n=1 Tax=Pseudooceanicola marinus TaxID=396013 RepID=A0A1X6Z2A8_9RHOB|nr:glycosyltransferase family 25 protein [Pseudooceanicola marinus]PJE32422.1 hypothetical protein CVM50_05820 [Pseudooceanicola marinus]SLN37874.1 Glycosyltransferase family 25 (LPS biosynthesis protein) [Pseudooceanicola marinus]
MAQFAQLSDLSVQVINLDKAERRLKHMQAELSALGLCMDRCAAITPAELKSAARDFDIDLKSCQLSEAEQACFLSHVRAWQSAASAEGWTLILEDDVFFSADTQCALEFACQTSRADIVRLETYGRGRVILSTAIVASEGHFELRQLHGRALGAAAYLIRPDAAQRLLDQVKTFDTSVDGLLFGGGSSTGLRLQQLMPAVAVQGDQIDLLLPTPDATWLKLDKELFTSQIGSPNRTYIPQGNTLTKLLKSLNRRLLRRPRVRIPLSPAGPLAALERETNT